MNRKSAVIFFIFVYILTAVLFLKSAAGTEVSGEQLTTLCLESSLPSMELISIEEADAGQAVNKVTAAGRESEKLAAKKMKKRTGKPRVLIYHTHATESYLPSSEGNYHRMEEKNTVRDAGNILAETLEEKGIGVVHDKTLHDNPSYNDSYSRSYETVKELLAKYPSIECIVDLHRDATPKNISGPVQKIDGKSRAQYSYVISTTTDTYSANNAFIDRLNRTAYKDFDGYSGKVLERPYWYNQELSGKAILIEMGNNRNHIKDVRNCAESFGGILAETLNGE